ncbi:MAG TPA: DUF2442 domain-containing protein [Candidatus Saccharimonadales bacterium]|jgi:hypothetical protein|nr:DUF2442 domain-containing protein [Candidatus Saccharimonadales bacterium]
MNKAHKVVTTDSQIEAAREQARQFEADDRRVRRATYEKSGDRVCLFLANDVIVTIPRKQLQGLENAVPPQLSRIEVLGSGTGLHWPQLDVSHYVPGLLNNILGTSQWMAHLGRMGGVSKSGAKRTAARANGRKGGRPRKSVPA